MTLIHKQQKHFPWVITLCLFLSMRRFKKLQKYSSSHCFPLFLPLIPCIHDMLQQSYATKTCVLFCYEKTEDFFYISVKVLRVEHYTLFRCIPG